MDRVDVLFAAREQLDTAATLEELQHVVRTAARRLVAAQGATFVLRDGDLCFYADEDAMSPLWKGQRFPIETCISGWAMLNRRAAVIPDITVDERIPQAAYKPTFVRSLVMVPIGTDVPLGAIGAYWSATNRPSASDAADLTELADATAVALERILVATRPWGPVGFVPT
jgi:GAF domain-containing protein